eukprot:g26428.t1
MVEGVVNLSTCPCLPAILSRIQTLEFTRVFLLFLSANQMLSTLRPLPSLGKEWKRLKCLIEKQKAENPRLLQTPYDPSPYMHIVCRDNTKGKCSRTSCKCLHICPYIWQQQQQKQQPSQRRSRRRQTKEEKENKENKENNKDSKHNCNN